jgi:hypothetical protein
MKCTGYDKDFQRTLASMPPDYVSPNDGVGKMTSKGKKRKAGSEESPKQAGTKGKRCKIETDKQNRNTLKAQEKVGRVGGQKKGAAGGDSKRKRVVTNQKQ